jgi:hypothetical protein
MTEFTPEQENFIASRLGDIERRLDKLLTVNTFVWILLINTIILGSLLAAWAKG